MIPILDYLAMTSGLNLESCINVLAMTSGLRV